MGSASQPSVLRGLIVPDPRFRYAAGAVSTTSQQGPLPGVPEAQDQTEMLVEATGTQAATDNFRLRTLRGGHPGEGATMVWRRNTDTASQYRGWDPPTSLTGWESIDSTIGTNAWRGTHTVATPDGRILVATTKDQRYVTVWVRDPDDGSWDEVEVYDHGTTYSTVEFHPCLVVLPSGRVLCLFWREYSSGALAQLRMHYADADYTSWTPGQKQCLPDAIDTTAYVPGRVRAAYLAGEIGVFADMAEQSAPQDEIWQWQSSDLGATMRLVSTLEATDRKYVDVVAHEGSLVVAYVSATPSSGATYPAYCRVLGSASESLAGSPFYLCQVDTDSMDWATQSGGVFDDGDLALWSDEDGRLWIAGRDTAGDMDVQTRTSEDGGRSWVDAGRGPAAADGVSLWIGLDTSTYPRKFSAVAHRGRAFLAHQFAANPGTRDDSLCGLWAGGYTSVCMPQQVAVVPSPLRIGGFAVTWLPFDFPDDTGGTWTRTTGTGSRTIAGYMQLITTAGQAEAYAVSSIPGTTTEGLLFLGELQVLSGTAFVELRVSDATPDEFTVHVNVTPTSITAYDTSGPTQKGSVATTDAADGFIQLFMQLSDNRVVVWYHAVSPTGDRRWTQVAASSTISNTTTASSNRVRFGQGASTTARWRAVAYSSDQYTEVGIIDQDNWSDLLGRAWMPTPVWVSAGLSVHAIDGPTFRGDDWDVDPRYRYPVSNVFPDVSASPRHEGRSVDDASDWDIEFELATSITHIMGPLLSVYLGGGNFPTAYLDGLDAGGSWVRIATLDRRAGTGLYFGRSHRIIRPQSGSADVGHYLPHHILEGSYYAMGDGAEGFKTRKISTNSAGVYTGALNSLQTRILLEEVDGTEAVSGTDGQIWMRDTAHIIPHTTRYRKYRVRVEAVDTAEGYLKLGALIIGHFFPTGAYLQEQKWNRVREWATSWEEVTTKSGGSIVHATAPGRRASEVQWVDGVNTKSVQTDLAPSWVIGWVGGQAVAVPADVPWSVPGLLEELEGATTPVAEVLAADLPPDATTPVHVVDRTLLLYGRLKSATLRADRVIGDPETGEVIRLGSVRLEELR